MYFTNDKDYWWSISVTWQCSSIRFIIIFSVKFLVCWCVRTSARGLPPGELWKIEEAKSQRIVSERTWKQEREWEAAHKSDTLVLIAVFCGGPPPKEFSAVLFLFLFFFLKYVWGGKKKNPQLKRSTRPSWVFAKNFWNKPLNNEWSYTTLLLWNVKNVLQLKAKCCRVFMFV